MPAAKDQPAAAPAAHEEAAASKPTELRLKYRKPWPVFIPVVVSFMLLNYLVVSTETDDTGKWRILPDYVYEAAEARDNALRDFEEVPVSYSLFFEEVIMGSLFRLGCRLFGGLPGIQLVLAAAWVVHMFELGMCVRICVACKAPLLVMARYCYCTTMSGFAQLMPLRKARDEYVKALNEQKDGKKAADKAKKATAEPEVVKKNK